MADLGVGDQVGNAVNHAQTGAQDGNNADGLAGEHLYSRFADGGFDFNRFGGQIAGNFVHHQHGNFIQQLTERLGAGVLIAHNAQLVLDQGMVEYMYFAHNSPPHCVILVNLIYYKEKPSIRQALFWIIFCHCEHEKDNLLRSGSRLPAPAAAPGI